MGPGPGRGAWERVSPRGGCRAWGRYRQGLPVSPWKSAGLPGARRLENVFFFFLKKKQKTKSTPPGPGRGAWERVRPRGGCRARARHRQGLPVSPWKSAGLPGARNFETVYQGHGTLKRCTRGTNLPGLRLSGVQPVGGWWCLRVGPRVLVVGKVVEVEVEVESVPVPCGGNIHLRRVECAAFSGCRLDLQRLWRGVGRVGPCGLYG